MCRARGLRWRRLLGRLGALVVAVAFFEAVVLFEKPNLRSLRNMSIRSWSAPSESSASVIRTWRLGKPTVPSRHDFMLYR
mmetsp:Transcript_3870/g.11631  ORF Transcript_3870/g.11631 Transcript_3870/m.11631 type:complete len:80 (-) Transcript_3870:126-365(-)